MFKLRDVQCTAMTGRRRSQSPMVECFSCRHHGNGRTQRQLTRHRQPSPSVYLCFQGCNTFNRKNRYGFTSFAGHCLLFVLLLTSIVALTQTRSFETHNIEICETINDYCISNNDIENRNLEATTRNQKLDISVLF